MDACSILGAPETRSGLANNQVSFEMVSADNSSAVCTAKNSAVLVSEEMNHYNLLVL